MKQITVLGTGNILMQDEGFGVAVVEELGNRYLFPNFVKVLDGGTLGMELLPFLTESDHLIIIDAVKGGKPPGTLYEFTGDEVKLYFGQKISVHELGVRDILTSLEIMGIHIKELKLIGIEPETIDVGISLTEVVRQGVDKVVLMVINQLKNWQVEIKEVENG
jgi:hydrogenase maturation protease